MKRQSGPRPIPSPRCSTRTKRAIARSSRPWPPSLSREASAVHKSHWPGFVGAASSSHLSWVRARRSHIDDAVASLVIDLTDEEVAHLEQPYTPRYDFQRVSDDAVLAS